MPTTPINVPRVPFIYRSRGRSVTLYVVFVIYAATCAMDGKFRFRDVGSWHVTLGYVPILDSSFEKTTVESIWKELKGAIRLDLNGKDSLRRILT